MSSLTNDELQNINALIRDRKLQPSVKQDLIEAVEHARVASVNDLETYIATRPHLFIDPPKDRDSKAVLEAEAFNGRGNVTARGGLAKAIGEDAANERARAWGLKNLADTRTRGEAPEGAGDKSKAKKPDASNPFSKAGWNLTKQSQLVKSLGIEKAAAIARAAGVIIGATRPAM